MPSIRRCCRRNFQRNPLLQRLQEPRFVGNHMIRRKDSRGHQQGSHVRSGMRPAPTSEPCSMLTGSSIIWWRGTPVGWSAISCARNSLVITTSFPVRPAARAAPPSAGSSTARHQVPAPAANAPGGARTGSGSAATGEYNWTKINRLQPAAPSCSTEAGFAQ